jgi:hypothetical protein
MDILTLCPNLHGREPLQFGIIKYAGDPTPNAYYCHFRKFHYMRETIFTICANSTRKSLIRHEENFHFMRNPTQALDAR